jgi:(1->4)-alpha-D-glucan 1-alpha-D-glucosylmutase
MADHLHDLGVSHAYLSPVLAAAPGSLHGYDVVDHARIDPELGGEAGLRAAATRLRERGIGIVLDVVPNHMAMTVPEHMNRVVWSVLRDGAASPHAAWLDLDWTADRPVLLPFLGRRIDECLDAGEIALDPTGGPDGDPVVRYYEHVLPVRPGTEHLPLEELLAAQAYRLAFWRVADEELNYRRFFDIDTLVGLRVEDPAVFTATHAVVLRLLGEGLASGLRIDHPDGLADPRGYLERLAADAPAGTWVVVEKILEEDEELPADWPCAGTTGYDALAAVGGAFVDADGAPVLTAAFAELAGADETWPEAADRARRDVLRGPLVAEVDRLARVAHEVCQAELRLRDHSLRGLTEAVFELLGAMPVYRAYVVPGEPATEEAVAVLDVAAGRAGARCPGRAAEVGLLRDLALGRLGRGARKDEFCVRFQQTTGPVMAKGVEDTAAYRWFPLTALAEVGSRPDRFGAGSAGLHGYASRRLAGWPDSMSALSTHDAKRSEDTRARLLAISEIPAEWVSALRGWRSSAGELGDDRLGWLMWQTLVGAWPMDAERLTTYLLKAAREAKLRTSWTSPELDFEEGIGVYVRRVLADEAVMGSVAAMVDRLHPAFVANCLGQRAVQLLLPGVPDVYSGCESVNVRLVDPDNREPPDLVELGSVLRRGLGSVPDPRTDLPAAKARLTALGLRLRRDNPGWFGGDGGYEPLAATGPAAAHVLGFVRSGRAAVVSTRLALRLAAAGGWRESRVALPAGAWTDLLTGRTHESAGEVDGLPAAELMVWPVALLVRGER